MACVHRFVGDLAPNWGIEYLFVGTFNPSWNRDRDNANWFYGRSNNDFWYIMPQVFNQNSLMDRQYRTDRNFLMNWCLKNKIGITDLFTSINDADENNPQHRENILSVNDNFFDGFNDITPTNVIEIIDRNKKTLKGVYLTRYEHTLNQNGIVMQYWIDIKNHCIKNNINTHDLVTPSRQFRQINRNEKLTIWREVIQR